MNRRLSILSCLTVLVLTAQLRAQQQEPYPRGENIRGTVSSIDDKRLVLTDGSDTEIALTADTHYRKVDDATHEFKDVARGDVKKGMYGTVANFRNGNQIIARYVFLATDRDTLNAGWARKHEEDAKKAATASQPTTTPTAEPASTQRSADVPLSHQDPTIAAVKTGPNGEKFLQMHQKFLARAKEGNIGVLFLGDSITAGWTKAPDLWAQRYEPLHAANFGIGGDRTQHVLWRIENGELDIKPDPKVVVLMIGTNNSNTDPAGQIAMAIEKIVQEIHGKLPRTRILLLGVFPRSRPTDKPDQMDTIHRINETISKLDDGGKTVKYLDIGDKFLGPDGKVPLDIMPDGLHPNEKGYQIWADAMQPVLDQLMK
jgi:lysophospholipase L1-like esterase